MKWGKRNGRKHRCSRAKRRGWNAELVTDTSGQESWHLHQQWEMAAARNKLIHAAAPWEASRIRGTGYLWRWQCWEVLKTEELVQNLYLQQLDAPPPSPAQAPGNPPSPATAGSWQVLDLIPIGTAEVGVRPCTEMIEGLNMPITL